MYLQTIIPIVSTIEGGTILGLSLCYTVSDNVTEDRELSRREDVRNICPSRPFCGRALHPTAEGKALAAKSDEKAMFAM